MEVCQTNLMKLHLKYLDLLKMFGRNKNIFSQTVVKNGDFARVKSVKNHQLNKSKMFTCDERKLQSVELEVTSKG